ncbi:MAG: hypothetical protein EXR75_04255 [Myxococcales bacterium]|nr:hypothetical protein [Myxococcales bacterium]
MDQEQPHRATILRRARVRAQRVRTALVLALPALAVVLTDVSLRGARILHFPAKYVGSYLAAVLESCLLWALLLACASARRGHLRQLAAAFFVALATVVVGSQLYFYRQYATYLNLDATVFGASMGESVLAQLAADHQNFAFSVAPPCVVALALVWLARRTVRARRITTRRLIGLTPFALALVLTLPCSYRALQGSTPDVLYLHAMGGLAKTALGLVPDPHMRPMRRTPPTLPKLRARPAAPRNVLFILSESLRADVGCSEHSASCPTMPRVNGIVPHRLPLTQMRANATTTAIELAVLWSGLEPNAGREALHSAPVWFDFAHAAGWDTAYWTSHHMLFANSLLWVQDLPLRFFASATTLDAHADVDVGADDGKLAAQIEQQLPALTEPFFALAQFGNTHTPYLVDPDDSPFQPSLASRAPEDNEAHRNYYKNAVYRQDKAIAKLIAFVRAQPFGARTVIVFTSDHGEQFREHDQLGHTCSVFDVELHVPAWLDAPEKTLTPDEQAALVSHANEPTFHTDLAVTVLDLLGLAEAPELAPFRARMPGRSLLRPLALPPILALTNCAGVWGCAFENWGVMRGWRKVHAREWDTRWLCHDVLRDPRETSPLAQDDPECAPLVLEANRLFGGLPGRQRR